MVGLRAVASRPVGMYSKGMARRIGLAQALINDPDLLILDEPTTGLDPIGTRQIKDLILKLAERGKTILLCSHLLADVEDVCDRIAILYGGRIQAEGQVQELLQQSGKRQIVTSAVSDAAVDKIRQILEDERAECEITSPLEKLETFFIHTVVEAQQQARPTSGAVSTTQIGDFLMAQKSQAGILDKLVSARVSETKPAEPPRTDHPQPTEVAAPEPDRDLLGDLTKPASTAKTEGVAPAQPKSAPSEVAEVPDDQQVRKGVLDALTDKAPPPSTEQPDQGHKDEEGGHG